MTYQTDQNELHGIDTLKTFVTIFITGIPMPPVDFHYRLLSNKELHMSWIPGMNGGSQVTFIIEYKHSDESSWTEVKAGTNSSKVLTNVDGWDSMLVRVRARNIHGTSKPSKELHIGMTYSYHIYKVTCILQYSNN